MGFVSVIAHCIRCNRVFSCSPTKVPSVRVKGAREPLCATCFAHLNELRVKIGMPPIHALPGAYEADDESELGE